MSFAACPRCHDEISVPLGVRPSARVRCPLCREEMLLSEVLDRLPPMLEVLDPADAAPAAAPAWQTGGEAVYSPSDYAADSADQTEYAPAKEEHDPMGGMVAAATAPMVGGATQLRQRKQPNVLVEMVKIVLGGVVGIVLAIAVLWWGLGKDPLKMGPSVAPYAAWAVPEKFQGKPVEKPSNPAPNPPGVRPSPPAVTPPSVPNNNTPANNTPETVSSENRFAEAFNRNKPPEDQPPPEKPEAGAPNAPELIALFTAVQMASDEFTASAGQDKETRQKLGTDLYAAFADAGAKLVLADMTDPNIGQVVSSSGLETLSPAAVRNTSMLGSLTTRQIMTGEDQTGVAFIGEVKDFKKSGQWFEMTVDLLPKKEREVVVFYKTNPQDSAQVGGKVVVLGALQKDPKGLKGYRGDTTEGVRGGLIIAAE